MDYEYSDISKMVDHALLSPTLTMRVIEAGCRLAVAYDVASVCMMPFALKSCLPLLRNTTVKPSVTIGFPQGGQTTATKVAEARQALDEGAEELDIVINISQALSGNWDYVRRELDEVIHITHSAAGKAKVIFENCYLTNDHKLELCRIGSECGADWIKTSTGFGSGGATLDDVRLMRTHAAPHVQVKAAGGIRDFDALLAMRALGATRCGTSRTAEILDDCRSRLKLPPLAAAGKSAVEGY